MGSFFTIETLGRRKMFLIGSAGQMVSMIITFGYAFTLSRTARKCTASLSREAHNFHFFLSFTAVSYPVPLRLPRELYSDSSSSSSSSGATLFRTRKRNRGNALTLCFLTDQPGSNFPGSTRRRSTLSVLVPTPTLSRPSPTGSSTSPSFNSLLLSSPLPHGVASSSSPSGTPFSFLSYISCTLRPLERPVSLKRRVGRLPSSKTRSFSKIPSTDSILRRPQWKRSISSSPRATPRTAPTFTSRPRWTSSTMNKPETSSTAFTGNTTLARVFKTRRVLNQTTTLSPMSNKRLPLTQRRVKTVRFNRFDFSTLRLSLLSFSLLDFFDSPTRIIKLYRL